MEMKIESAIKDDRQIYKVGKFEFQNYADAEAFVAWFSWLLRRRRELSDAPRLQQQEQSGSGVMLHDLVSDLAYLSFALAAAGAVEQLHLAMIRQIHELLEKTQRMTKGDVACIMGDEWAKEHIGTSLKDKLKTAQEPAPPEWVKMAKAKQEQPDDGGGAGGWQSPPPPPPKKKTPSPGM